MRHITKFCVDKLRSWVQHERFTPIYPVMHPAEDFRSSMARSGKSRTSQNIGNSFQVANWDVLEWLPNPNLILIQYCPIYDACLKLCIGSVSYTHLTLPTKA